MDREQWRQSKSEYMNSNVALMRFSERNEFTFQGEIQECLLSEFKIAEKIKVKEPVRGGKNRKRALEVRSRLN
jgi:hypothetical protein